MEWSDDFINKKKKPVWLKTANFPNKIDTFKIIGLDLLLTFYIISVSGLEFEVRRSER